MGLRPPSQALELPIAQILEGIKPGAADFSKAVEERVASGDWPQDHIQELIEIMQDMTRLRVRLQKLAADTW